MRRGQEVRYSHSQEEALGLALLQLQAAGLPPDEDQEAAEQLEADEQAQLEGALALLGAASTRKPAEEEPSRKRRRHQWVGLEGLNLSPTSEGQRPVGDTSSPEAAQLGGRRRTRTMSAGTASWARRLATVEPPGRVLLSERAPPELTWGRLVRRCSECSRRLVRLRLVQPQERSWPGCPAALPRRKLGVAAPSRPLQLATDVKRRLSGGVAGRTRSAGGSLRWRRRRRPQRRAVGRRCCGAGARLAGRLLKWARRKLAGGLFLLLSLLD